jgi:hypothetical protein
MISLDSLVEKIWGYKPSTLNSHGVSTLLTDCMQVLICGFLLVAYPKELSTDLTIKWVGAVALLLLMLYGFFPAMMRLMYGTWYEHTTIESDDEEAQ